MVLFNFSPAKISELQWKAVTAWHKDKVLSPKAPFLALVLAQHRYNYDLWHTEDEARRTDISDAEIAGVKRRIDKMNQSRNDTIEKIDDCLVAEILRLKVRTRGEAGRNTETPGSAIDRLSILNLRRYHLREETRRKEAEAAHLKKCRIKLAIVLDQQKDLVESLSALLKDIFAGRKRLKVYRQMKMYNDPSLNPALYKPR